MRTKFEDRRDRLGIELQAQRKLHIFATLAWSEYDAFRTEETPQKDWIAARNWLEEAQRRAMNLQTSRVLEIVLGNSMLIHIVRDRWKKDENRLFVLKKRKTLRNKKAATG